MTTAERKHLDAVAGLGCIVCHREGLGFAPAEIHHLKRNPETGGRGTRTPPTPQEWAYLLAEREGILLDAGLAEPLARAAAFQDTVRVHGPRPMADSRGAVAPRSVRSSGGAL